MVWHRHGCHNAVPTSHKAAYFARTYTTSSSLLHFASLTEPLQVINVRQFARKYNFMQTNQRECLQRVHFHKENVFFSYMHASVFARQQSVEHFLPFYFKAVRSVSRRHVVVRTHLFYDERKGRGRVDNSQIL